jgi:hypothetical protein
MRPNLKNLRKIKLRTPQKIHTQSTRVRLNLLAQQTVISPHYPTKTRKKPQENPGTTGLNRDCPGAFLPPRSCLFARREREKSSKKSDKKKSFDFFTFFHFFSLQNKAKRQYNTLYRVWSSCLHKGVSMKRCYCFWRVRAAAWLGILLSLTACSVKGAAEHSAGAGDEAGLEEARLLVAARGIGGSPLPEQSVSVQPDTELLDRLERLAEQERSNGFASGAGLRESALREQGGDYAGAVFATFKELFWAYSFAVGEERAHSLKSAIESGFGGMMSNLADALSPAFAEEANRAAEASLAFFSGRYGDAEVLLAGLRRDDAEPDEFSAWMSLVCALENAAADKPPVAEEAADIRRLRASYAAIRSRYETLPAYWYFGAHNMKGENIPAYAERAINLSPDGPYAADARVIIAEFVGLPPTDGTAIMSMYEIETVATNAANAGNPEMLAALFPLTALPDNPYTLYAAGVLRGLASDMRFKNYFDVQLALIKADKKSDRSRTRLAERLAYIVRG